MLPTSVYLGVDVACAKGKRLPVCVVKPGRPLTPLTIDEDIEPKIPRGKGNREVIVPDPFRESARDVVNALRQIADKKNWRIERIAIDAPAARPPRERKSEVALASRGLSSFKTPTSEAWPGILKACADHLGADRSLVTLPHANKIWMLFGFELFAQLRAAFEAEVIEVYPFAIARALVPNCSHKSTEEGYRRQLDAVAERTGWASSSLDAKLKATVHGARHDRLDAFMSAWVASLSPDERTPIGHAQDSDDVIWVPHSIA